MTGVWHGFVIVGTVGSLIFFLALLYGNRKTSSDATTGHDFDGIEEYDSPLPMWWVWMFALTVAFAFGYLLWYPGLGNFGGLAGWSSADELERAQARHDERFAPLYAELAALTEDELHGSRQARQVGRRLFINHCSTCHGVSARGAFGFPDLTDDEWLWGEDLDSVKTSITRGRSAAMPAWGDALGDDGVTAATHFVLQLAGRDHQPDAAARGAGHYQTFCASCHGAGGTGNPAVGAPDLTNDVWLYGGDPEQLAHTIRHGRNGNMPAFADLLSGDKIHVLSGYVTSLGEERAEAR